MESLAAIIVALVIIAALVFLAMAVVVGFVAFIASVF
jgi:hypothetical protein